MIQTIKKEIQKIDLNDSKFTNPKYKEEKSLSKILKIVIIHKDYKSYINFYSEDFKVLKMILAFKFHLYNSLKLIINIQFTSKLPPKLLPSHPIPTIKLFDSNNLNPKTTFVLFGDEFKWKKCPEFFSFHKKHFSKFGFSCHMQKYEFWKLIEKENIDAIVINDISHKYRNFIFDIIDGKK